MVTEVFLVQSLEILVLPCSEAGPLLCDDVCKCGILLVFDSSGLNVPPVAETNVPGIAETNVPAVAE